MLLTKGGGSYIRMYEMHKGPLANLTLKVWSPIAPKISAANKIYLFFFLPRTTLKDICLNENDIEGYCILLLILQCNKHLLFFKLNDFLTLIAERQETCRFGFRVMCFFAVAKHHIKGADKNIHAW